MLQYFIRDGRDKAMISAPDMTQIQSIAQTIINYWVAIDCINVKPDRYHGYYYHPDKPSGFGPFSTHLGGTFSPLYPPSRHVSHVRAQSRGSLRDRRALFGLTLQRPAGVVGRLRRRLYAQQASTADAGYLAGIRYRS